MAEPLLLTNTDENLLDSVSFGKYAGRKEFAGTAMEAHTLFEVSGVVKVRIVAVCKLSLTSAGAATIEVGVTSNTATIIAQTTATSIDIGHIWSDASPTNIASLSEIGEFIVSGNDIICTIATAALTAGRIDFHCFYEVIEKGSTVTVAV